MAFNFRTVDGQPPPPPLPPASFPAPSNFPFLHNNQPFGEMMRNEMVPREAVELELKKERIREGMIADEIARMHRLEAEGHRELMMGRERPPPPERYPFPPPVMAASATDFEATPFLSPRHGSSSDSAFPIHGDCRTSFAQSPIHHTHQARSSRRFGAKRKSMMLPPEAVVELSVASPVKKLKEVWSCDLCQVSSLSKQNMDKHMQGKRHKVEEMNLRGRETSKDLCCVQLTGSITSRVAEAQSILNEQKGEKLVESLQDGQPRETQVAQKGEKLVESLHDGQTRGVQVAQKGERLVESLQNGQTREAGILHQQVADFKENDSHIEEKGHVGEKTTEKQEHVMLDSGAKDSKKMKSKSWSQMFQVGINSAKTMNEHEDAKHITPTREYAAVGGAAIIQQDSEEAKAVENMNDHMQGKRQKVEEINLRGRETSKDLCGVQSTGSTTSRVAESLQDGHTRETEMEQKGEKLDGQTRETEILHQQVAEFKQNDSHNDENSHVSEKTTEKQGHLMLDSGAKDSKKMKSKFWCEMCQVGTPSEKNMNDHANGKKHIARTREYAAVGGASIIQKDSEEAKAVENRSNCGNEKTSGCAKVEHTMKFWCDLCQLRTDNEKILNSHKMGKKHMSRVRKLHATPDAAKLASIMPSLEHGENAAVGGTAIIQKDSEEAKAVENISNHGNVKTSGNSHQGAEVKNTMKFWCDLCQIKTRTETMLNSHKMGKKHMARVRRLHATPDAAKLASIMPSLEHGANATPNAGRLIPIKPSSEHGEKDEGPNKEADGKLSVEAVEIGGKSLETAESSTVRLLVFTDD